MNFNEFKNRMQEDLVAALEDVSPGVQVETNFVQKLQGESYEALTVKTANSSIGMNLNVNRLFERMENGTDYDTLLDEAVDLASEELDHIETVEVPDITSYENVLPSSVHEVLLLKDDGELNAAQLSGMVYAVNTNEVSAAEQLSDNVYHYDADERFFRIFTYCPATSLLTWVAHIKIRAERTNRTEVISMKMIIKLIAKIVLFPVVLLLRIVGVMADILTKLGVYVISPVVLFCLIAGVVCGINKEWTNMGLMLGFDAFLIVCTFVTFLVPEAINGICNFLSDLGK